MLPIVLVAIGAAGAAASGAIGSKITNKIKSRKELETQNILSGESANYPKILICGSTGAGKSSLINNVLGTQVAQIGSGGSVTRGVSEYFTDSKMLRFCECEGYTVGNIDVYKQRVEMFLRKNSVDSVWYCVNAGTKRLLETDEKNIKQLIDLAGDKPVTVVITKTDTVSRQELKDLTDSVDSAFPSLEFTTFSTDAKLAKQTADSIERLTERFYDT